MGKIIITLLAVFLITGCASQETEQPEDNDMQQEEVNKEEAENEEVEATDEEDTKEEDKKTEEETIKELNVQNKEDITQEIEQEETVSSVVATTLDLEGKTYLLVDINVDEVTEAEDLAIKYANQYKEQYPDDIVDVKVLKDGETLAQETRE